MTQKKQDTYSLKEIDEARGVAKGTAFSAFKQIREALVEGRDFIYLSHESDAAEIEDLRRSGRIYESSMNAVLLTTEGRAAVAELLDD